MLNMGSQIKWRCVTCGSAAWGYMWMLSANAMGKLPMYGCLGLLGLASAVASTFYLSADPHIYILPMAQSMPHDYMPLTASPDR